MITSFKELLASLYQLIAECQAKQELNVALVNYTPELGGGIAIHVTNGKIGIAILIFRKNEIDTTIHMNSTVIDANGDIIDTLKIVSNTFFHNDAYKTILKAIEDIKTK